VRLSSFDTTGLYTQQPAPHLAPFTIHHSPFNIQCDSVRHLQLTVDYTHYATDYRIGCDSLQWPMDASRYPIPATRYYYRDTLGVPGSLGSHRAVGPVDTLLTVGGCDSVVNLDLNVHYATFEGVIDTFCYESPEIISIIYKPYINTVARYGFIYIFKIVIFLLSCTTRPRVSNSNLRVGIVIRIASCDTDF
jgi:hypothetical protein